MSVELTAMYGPFAKRDEHSASAGDCTRCCQQHEAYSPAHPARTELSRSDSEATLVPSTSSLSPESSVPKCSPNFTPAPDESPNVAAVHRKLDLRLVLFYSVVHLILKVSQRNITNVAILNAESPSSNIKIQLGNLTSQQWAWIVSAFFYTDILFEPISVLMMKKFTPRVWMARIMITWGIVAACQAACSSFAGLLTCRVILGWAEAGFLSGVLYHLSFWYPADRLTMRISVLAGCAYVSGTFSGTLAYGISFMNDVGGLAGWRWIFLIEGLPAVALGIITLFCLPIYPRTAKFLTQKEKDLVIRYLPPTQPSAESKTWDFEEVKALVLKDVTFWSFQALWLAHTTGAESISLALPTITYALQLENSSVSQLLTMPPFALGCGLTLCLGAMIHVNRWKPWITALILETVILTAYVLLLAVRSAVAKYCFVVIAMACGMAVLPMLWPERIRAVRGTTSTGFAIGVTSAIAHCAGLVGPHIYQTEFGPLYRVSYTVCIVLVVGAVLSVLFTWSVVRRRESAARAGPLQQNGTSSADEV